jgi:hypothetical protein
MHDLLVVGVPLLASLGGGLLNRQDVLTLRTDINRRFDLVDARFDSIQRDMREFYGEQARHDVRIAALEQK